MTIKIGQAITLIPEWEKKTVSVKPIYGGITNNNYKVLVENISYFVSISGRNLKSLGADLSNKYFNNKICEELKISPRILHFFESKGVTVSEFINFPTLSLKSLRKPDVQKRLIEALKILHKGPAFMGQFDMFELIKKYLKIVEHKKIDLPSGFKDCLMTADRIGKKLKPSRKELTPCHNDLIPENILDDGHTIYFIDFDYSGQNNLYSELGNLCIEAKFSDSEVRNLLITYFGHIDEEMVSRTLLHGVLSDIGWSLWSLIQNNISHIDFDFMTYGWNRWERVENKMLSGSIERWMESI